MSETLTVDDFTPRVGEAFAVVADGAEGFALELVDVRGHGSAFGGREAFSLLFRGPAAPVIGQATYRLANEQLGEIDIFMVPVARTAESADYEAIFT